MNVQCREISQAQILSLLNAWQAVFTLQNDWIVFTRDVMQCGPFSYK
jgi:hypothetical protein